MLSVFVIVLLFWRGDRQRALLVFFMVGLGLAIEAGFNLRGYHLYYRIFIDPWLFLAVAIGLDALVPWRHQLSKILFAGALLLLTGWLTVLSLGDKMVPRQNPKLVCGIGKNYFDLALGQRIVNFHCPGGQISENKGLNSAK